MTHPLDNPFHAALSTLHREVAQQAGEVVRYPADIAPFLGIAHAGAALAAALPSLVPPGDTVLMLGVMPTTVPAGWSLSPFPDLAQMQCERANAPVDGPAIVSLDERHRADVLALTALVYPHYFRPRTTTLGRYFGIYRDGRLAAMIGERLGAPGHRELSAICTHPDHTGQGLARRLTAFLAGLTLQEGNVPFLHVAPSNVRAKALYDGMGFRVRREIAFAALRRV